jgi:hypothetical protein
MTRIISLARKIGDTLAGRKQAEELRKEILASPDSIRLDFSGIKSMSYSFATELFGGLLEEGGKDILTERITIKNVRVNSRAMVNEIIEKHVKTAKKNSARAA